VSADTADEVPPLSNEPPPPTHRQAADLLNVSSAAVDRSRMVLLHGTPELQRAVEDNLIPLASALRTRHRCKTTWCSV
jgi:hypothetical protein